MVVKPYSSARRAEIGSQDRAVGRGPLQQLHVVVFGGDVTLQQHVGVGVDQSGKADLPAEIDDLGARFRT